MHKTIVCRYDVNSTYIKSIVCMYDVREKEQARISCVLIANQNRAGDTKLCIIIIIITILVCVMPDNFNCQLGAS